MPAAAQINYPSDEDTKTTKTHEPDSQDGIEDEALEDFDVPEDAPQGHVRGASGDDPSPFEIPAEDFCANSYEEEGHVESRQELGRRGEEAAVRYLEAKGYEIIKRNWYCRFGEADIIARDADGTICFIEVKTRRSVEAGIPEEAITREKRRRYERIALCYMMVDDEWDDSNDVRFDAIGICATGANRAMLRHHKSCFNASF